MEHISHPVNAEVSSVVKLGWCSKQSSYGDHALRERLYSTLSRDCIASSLERHFQRDEILDAATSCHVHLDPGSSQFYCGDAPGHTRELFQILHSLVPLMRW
jgi:hypothetical protein